jgi:hypothetical protein
VIASLRPGIGQAGAVAPAEVAAPIVSPWAPPSHLASVVWNDMFGQTVTPITRAEAMRVPAVRRARNIVCNTIARIDLRDYRRGEDAPWPSRIRRPGSRPPTRRCRRFTG